MKNYPFFGYHRSLKPMVLLSCTLFFISLGTLVNAQQKPTKVKAILDTCYAVKEVFHTKVPPDPLTILRQAPDAISANALPLSGGKTAVFQITYEGFTPEAQAAFQYAVDIWSTIIVSTVPIKVNAIFTPLNPGILGTAGAQNIWGNFPKSKPNRFYVDALADALAGEDLYPEGGDITAYFNSNYQWYFGTDQNPPPGQFDFVTLVLH